MVHARVLGADGEPAIHRDVYLRGWDRRALGPLDAAPEIWRRQGWLFTTDQNGDVTVPIGNFAGWKDKDQRPGWGTYALLVEAGPNDAGGVSQRFWSGPPGDSFEQAQTHTNLQWGELLLLRPEGLNLSMGLEHGFTFRGRVFDDEDSRKPLPNVTVTTWNDLGVDTHTGYGGRVLGGNAVTNSNGEFEIAHQFRNILYVGFGGLWMGTKINGKWVVQENDVVEPPEEQYANIEVRVRTHPDFHYVGRITDHSGKPVAGADVMVGISSQPQATSYGDTHHFEHATTNVNGNYDLSASSPWATFLAAETKQLGRIDLKWPYDSPPIPPGRYDLVFPTIPVRP